MPKAPRGGIETFWRDWGNAPPQMLLAHCTMAHSGSWGRLVQALDRPAIAPDMPGHGQSGPLDPGRDYMDQWLSVAADMLGEGPLDLIGHSYGANVLLRLALERPVAVRSLVLIEPVFFAAAAGTPAFDDHVARVTPFVDAIEAGDYVLAAELFTEMWGNGASWAGMRAEQRHTLERQITEIPPQRTTTFQDASGLLAPGRLETLDLPVMLIRGDASPPIMSAVLDALAARLPHAEQAVIAGAGHMAPITHAGQVAAVLKPFFGR